MGVSFPLITYANSNKMAIKLSNVHSGFRLRVSFVVYSCINGDKIIIGKLAKRMHTA